MKKIIITLIFLGCYSPAKASENQNSKILHFFSNAWNGTSTTTIAKGALITRCECGNIIEYNNDFLYVKSHRPLIKKLQIPAFKVDFVTLKNEQKKGCYLLKKFSFPERNPFCPERAILFGATLIAGLGIYFYSKIHTD